MIHYNDLFCPQYWSAVYKISFHSFNLHWHCLNRGALQAPRPTLSLRKKAIWLLGLLAGELNSPDTGQGGESCLIMLSSVVSLLQVWCQPRYKQSQECSLVYLLNDQRRSKVRSSMESEAPGLSLKSWKLHLYCCHLQDGNSLSRSYLYNLIHFYNVVSW